MSDVINSNTAGALRAYVERVESLNEDKAAVLEDIKTVFIEAKNEGFDPKIMRKVVRLRAQDRAKRLEEEALIDLYMKAVQGELFDAPEVTITLGKGRGAKAA